MDEVTVEVVEARPTAVVAAAATPATFASLWRPMLDEVYACMRRNGVKQGANVMLYRDDTPHVEVGVEFINPCELDGSVKRSALPAGQVARTLHRGAYEDLGNAHRRVRQWCAEHGHALAGPLWEIYGDWHEDPDDLETEVYYLLS